MSFHDDLVPTYGRLWRYLPTIAYNSLLSYRATHTHNGRTTRSRHARQSTNTHPRMLTRRGAITTVVGGAALTLCLLALGCDSDTGETGSNSSSAPAQDIARQTVIESDGSIYYVNLASGSVVRSEEDGSDAQVLYTNGIPKLAGVRYIILDGTTVYFGDIPTGAVRAVSTSGGDPWTVYSSGDATKSLTPRVLESGRVYMSLQDVSLGESSLCSVRTDGSDYKEHFSLPGGFYAKSICAAENLVWYSGINDADEREIRSCSLDGSNENVVYAMEGVPSSSSELSWKRVDGRLVVVAFDYSAKATKLLSLSEDGSDAQVVYDFGARSLLFDYRDDTYWLVDTTAFSLLSLSASGGDPVTVSEIPRKTESTVVSLVEADTDKIWVTTLSSDLPDTESYAIYGVARDTGEVMQLV